MCYSKFRKKNRNKSFRTPRGGYCQNANNNNNYNLVSSEEKFILQHLAYFQSIFSAAGLFT